MKVVNSSVLAREMEEILWGWGLKGRAGGGGTKPQAEPGRREAASRALGEDGGGDRLVRGGIGATDRVWL